jgi:alpha-galactosidase
MVGMALPTPQVLGADPDLNLKPLTDLLPGPVPGKFAANLLPGLGLSFSHSGLRNADCMAQFKPSHVEDDKSSDGHRVRRIELENREQGLRATLEYTVFPEHHAIVYGGVLENIGLQRIPHLTNLLSYDLMFKPLQSFGDPLIHTSKGGGDFNFYPPAAWTLKEDRLFGPGEFSQDSGSTGRSSNDELPFFLVEDGNGSSGVFGGIEWSSLWHLRFFRRDAPRGEHFGTYGPDKSFAIQGGMREVDLTLETGEKFYIPRVLLGFYEGTVHDGRLALRHFLSDWAPPPPKGTPYPHVQATPGGYLTSRGATIDKTVRLNAAACAEIGAEYYCVEQWYPWYPYPSDDPETNKMTGTDRGSWVPDLYRFPDLKGLADYVRSLGMQFGLWTDVEVARSSSAVARQHPDWVLYLPGQSVNLPRPDLQLGPPEEEGLLNFGLQQVQQWAVALYDRLIEDYGIKWIFWDNNIDPEPYWKANEAPSRQGWLQHGHIRGVWAVRDRLLQKYPDVLIENCSSGGRRIDLGMFKRAHFHSLSDQFWYPDAIRYQFSGADWWLPADRIKSIVDAPLSPLADYLFQSNFGGLLSITENVESWTPEEKQKAKGHIEVYKSIRHLLRKDFYPLFPQPQSMKEWDGWQYHDPETGEGFVLAFRAESPEDAANLRFKKLEPGRRYSLQDPYHGKKLIVAGRTLMEIGLPTKLDLRGTSLWKYSPS